MTLSEDFKTYYVYQHLDPETGEVVYVGMGSGSRAWAMGTYRNAMNNKSYGKRAKEHFEWMERLTAKGYLPHEWVNILERGLTKDVANSKEHLLIKEWQPSFNAIGTQKYIERLRMWDKETHEFAKTLYEMGYGYRRIANLMGADIPKNKVVSIKRLIEYAYQ